MAEPVVIGFEQNKFIKDSNSKLITLIENSFIASYRALEVAETNTDYQVPAGKKFIILSVSMSSEGSTNSKNKFFAHNVANAAGGTEVLHMNLAGVGQIQTFPTYITIDAGDYINVYPDTNGCSYNVVGVELDV